MASHALPESHAPPPRVLFVATSAGEGGIERYSVRLAVLLRARGVPVTYACRPGGFLESQCMTHGIPTFAWEVRNSGDVTASRQLSEWLRAHPVDIVHVHSRRDYVPAVLGAAFVRPRPRLLLHAHLIRRLGEPPRLAGCFFQWGAAGVIAVSEAVRERLVQEHHFPPEFVHPLPNGVDTAAFVTEDDDRVQWQARRDASRRAWGVPTDACVLGMVGRLNAKGQETLLAVAPKIVQVHPKTWFVLVGPEGSANDAQRLRDQAKAAGIGGRVVLPGMTEDVPAAMAGFDILVHLPDDESFGLALAEAMAAGLPTVATDIGGCREVVQDGVTGTLVPLGDTGALVEALTCLLDPHAGPERRVHFGLAGRQRVLTEFSLDRQVERLNGLYRRLTSDIVASSRPGPMSREPLGQSRQNGASAFVALALAAFAVAALVFATITHHRISHRHVSHSRTTLHAAVAARADFDVPRRRRRATSAPIQALLRHGEGVRQPDADAEASGLYGDHV